ncbi:DUF6941 family protein [Pseudomonas oryzihabitans]|uniref:DUF6941 family protein n=1 Tax=Pseudomonas oryzihabitans TaxID=47885 RepID=UPI001E1A6DEB|nr:hypothetical protein [Pseudomonas oryzihabitans]HJE71432.1 hypothetical protein [Pseudomonas oryzihabitans]
MGRYAHVLYCDDIRNEVGNKLTLVGVYQGALVSAQIPALLPKLCVVLTLHTPKERMFEQVSVIGTYEDQEAFRMELGEEDLTSITAEMPPPGPETKSYEMTLMAMLAPFQIETAGKLKIEIIADGEELRCSSLQITAA